MDIHPRRRFRRAALAAAAGLLAAATAVAVAVVAHPKTASAAPARLTAANFRLQESAHDTALDSLDQVLPRASVADVLDSANRPATTCTAHAPSLVTSFCWRSDDETGSTWYPQGITTSYDADPTGTYPGRPTILVDWYYHPTTGTQKGDRIAFVDYSNPSKPVYRLVLLVAPFMNGTTPDFRPELDGDVSLHGGGMFWYGHYLYVADTWNGFRVFDLDHMWAVSSSGDGTTVGHQSDGSYQAFDYAYVLPQTSSYTPSTAGGYGRLRFSSVSVDHTGSTGPGDTAVVNEYNTGSTDSHRVVRFPLDETTNGFEASSDGLVHGTEAYETGITHMQGIASIHGRFYASTSFSTAGNHDGTLYTFTPTSSRTTYANALPPYPESLSYWGGGRDQLWSLSEHPGERYVYAMKASSLVPKVSWPTVSDGDEGQVVRTVQYLLNQHGASLTVDGDFGSATETAVERFQSSTTLDADGVVGPQTWTELVVPVGAGDSGDAVRAVQGELSAHGLPTPVTGTVDATTVANITEFQRSNGLATTGTVDTTAWELLVT